MNIPLPEIPYKDQLIYYIKKGTNISKLNKGWEKLYFILERHPKTKDLFKFTGNQYNEKWEWVGLEEVKVDVLEEVYILLYGKTKKGE